ncbi:glucosamine-6-phosphate deaminase [Microbacterium luteolum]|uniref:Glucosamine-6-phosphate deaminase n=1 Tax=Microbacterium luteolum TaxID=69367 RepID=A0ABY7XQR8_MICLT|nr:glucosamine-6-phosphate deaminase [Microbacterium luteolum]WDM44470.1 glucosamine-6-phosphate deaminase [Microbacterium luteolum]
MEVVIIRSAAEAGRIAADRVEAAIAGRPRPVLGLATGSSPLPVYRELADRVRCGLDLSHARGFALDEYVGLSYEHAESYHSVVHREVTIPLGLDPDAVEVPPGMAQDLAAAARRYDDAIVGAGGVDIQLLGIGSDGHIGFNEPTSSFTSRTRVKRLAERTRADNARFFGAPEDVPTHCVTQGLGTISEAREVVLLAFGAGKADAVAAAVEGPLASICPASVLQLHERATFILDEEAAQGLRLRDYYRQAYESSGISR